MENTFGENTKKLGFGMMRLPGLSTSGKFGNINIELSKKMVDYFISVGFSYFDTAWMHCGFKSEDAAGETLVSRHNRNRRAGKGRLEKRWSVDSEVDFE